VAADTIPPNKLLALSLSPLLFVCALILSPPSSSADDSVCGKLMSMHPKVPCSNLELQVMIFKLSNGPTVVGLAPVGRTSEDVVVVDLGVGYFIFSHYFE